MSRTITESRALHASAAETASDNGSEATFESREGNAYLDVTAFSGTTPTLDVDVEEQDSVSGKWFVIASFTQVGEATVQETINVPFVASDKVRVSWTIGGTGSPSYTFSVGIRGKDLR